MAIRMFVYFNLHNGLFSLRDQRSGHVLAHADTVILRDITFKVSEAGRQRVLREKKKNVHAGAIGTLVAWSGVRRVDKAGVNLIEADHYDWMIKHADDPAAQITYNPYKYSAFVNKATSEPVYTAPYVACLMHCRVPRIFSINPNTTQE